MGNKQSSSAHHPSKIRFSRDRDRALFHHKSTQFHEKSTPHAAISVRHYGSSPSIDSYNSQGVHVHTTTEKSAQLRPAKHARVKSLPSSKHAPHLRQSRVLPPVPCPTDRPAFAAPSTVGFVPPPILPSLHSTSISSPESDPVDPAALAAFLRAYPEYNLTWSLDVLRQNEFSRLNVPHARETYVDYMGGALYPVSLVSVHAEFLKSAVMGNTHSASSSSQLSATLVAEAREAVLAFFNAPTGSTVVFTANASSALKLVGEAFAFEEGSTFLLPEDAHNSVHGIREYARRKGAAVHYIPATDRGGVDENVTRDMIERHRPLSPAHAALFALTGLSNISNSKAPLTLLSHAAAHGYTTLLDAAALAATAVLDLTRTPADATAVSFYKMFGFPTGVGALVLAPGVGARLAHSRPWFAGGTVDVVQAPGLVFTRTGHVEEAFEDGTINYALLPAVTTGLRFLSAYLPLFPVRLSALTQHLAHALDAMRHPVHTGARRVARVLSRVPARRVRAVGGEADAGGVLAVVFYDASGALIDNSAVAAAAARERIALRTGCMCNPGGAAALLQLRALMATLGDEVVAGGRVTLCGLEAREGRELGVVRVSLGLASNFEDVWRVLRFVDRFVRGGEGRGAAPGPRAPCT